ncbi:MAG: hypothetical protein HY779_04775 [Rubrobacteridae bacterium]|nr:hypothetical protein [Rubrobacteridae bacterium]
MAPEKNPYRHERVEREDRESFTKKCLQRLSIGRRLVFKRVLKDAQAAIGYRERARLCQSLIYGELRRLTLETGKRFYSKGYLEAAEDVFFLEYRELHRIFEGKYLYPETIKEIIAVRRKAYQDGASDNPPEFYLIEKGEYPTIPVESGKFDAAEGKLTGLGVSRGSVKARARIILNPAENNTLEPGDILVTRTTDPGWTPLFLIAGGLILEKGGLLSHGAIVAREFGIPAIVGVKDAVNVIKDGQLLWLDAESGTIHVLDE